MEPFNYDQGCSYVPTNIRRSITAPEMLFKNALSFGQMKMRWGGLARVSGKIWRCGLCPGTGRRPIPVRSSCAPSKIHTNGFVGESSFCQTGFFREISDRRFCARMAVEGGLGIFHDRQSTVPARAPLQLKGGEIFSPIPFPPNEAASGFHWKAFALEGNHLRSAEKRGVVRRGVAFPGADLAKYALSNERVVFYCYCNRS